MKKIVFTLQIIALLIVALACSKSEEPVVPKTKTELLAGTVSKSWKNTKAQATNSQNLSIDLVVTQPLCITDNVVTFFPNNTYEFREGATKCNDKDPDLLIKANWSFSSDETKFTIDKIDYQGQTYTNTTFEIVELTEDMFVGKTTLKYGADTYQFQATFEAIK